MKNFTKILIAFTISLLVISCQKDIPQPINQVQVEEVDPLIKMITEIEPSLTASEIYKVKGSQSNTYTISDVLEFLGMYGITIPDVTPAFNNYYQDITGGASNLGQLSLSNGELFVTNTGVLITDTTGYTFDWYINDVLQCTEADPKLWDLDDNLSCDGVVEMRLDITTPQGAKYSRTQWAYIDYNYIDNCDCLNCPSLFEVFYTFYPDVPSYFYQVECAEFDFNCNQTIDSSDLLTILANFG